MCGPLALPLIAAGVSAVGTGVSALSANAQAQYKAKIDERNAAMERESEQLAQKNTQDAAQAQYRKIAAVTGAQRARAAAAGVGVDFGTAGDVQADTQALGSEDIKRIYDQGAQKVRGYDINASNDLGDASASRQAGTGALVSGSFSAAGSLLGGAQQYNKIKAGFG